MIKPTSLHNVKLKKARVHKTTLSHILKELHGELDRTFRFIDNTVAVKSSKNFLKDASIINLWNKIDKKLRVHHWKHIDKLRAIFAKFDGYENVMSKSIKVVGIKIFKRMKNIKQLTLNFGGCYKITPESFISFSRTITKNLKGVKSLTLNFSQCDKIDDKGFKSLVSLSSRSLTTLKQLKVDFSWCDKISDKALKTVCIYGSHMKILKDLHINISECQNITDKGLKTIGYFIGKRLNIIKHLTIQIAGCSKITANGFKLTHKSTKAKKQTPTLKSLSLDFSGCDKITNKSMEKIGLEINEFINHLEKLVISFSRCRFISDEGLKTLMIKVTKMFNLSQLVLNFSQCPQISDESFQIISSQFKKRAFRNLKHLNLYFFGCQKMTDDGIKCLVSAISGERMFYNWFLSLFEPNGIRSLNKLQKLILDISGCQNVTNNLKDKARSTLKFIPEVTLK